VRLAATPACSGAVAISAPGLKLDRGANVSIVAHLADAATATPTASVFANDVTIDFGRSRAIARPAANFGGIDVLIGGGVAFADLTNGEQETAALKPGNHTVAIAPAGSSTAVFEKTLRFKPFTVYVAYAVGTPANGTFEVLLQTLPMSREDEGPPSRSGGKCVLTNFRFRDIAGLVQPPPDPGSATYALSVLDRLHERL
jgi:hypothetical protein